MKNYKFSIYHFVLSILIFGISQQNSFAQHQNPIVVDINDGSNGGFSNTGGGIFIPNGTSAAALTNTIIYTATSGSSNNFEIGYFHPQNPNYNGAWVQSGTQGSIWIPSTAMTPTYSAGNLATLGITASTNATLDLLTGNTSSDPRNFVSNNNGLDIFFLSNRTGQNGMLSRLRIFPAFDLDDYNFPTGGNSNFLTWVNNTLLFSRNDGAATEQELWDAAHNNFTSLDDLLEINNANNGGTYPENLIEFNNQLFFAGFGGNQVTVDGNNINNSSYFWVYNPSSAISPAGFTQNNTAFAYSTANDATNNPRFINIPAFAPTRTSNTEPNNLIAKFERGGQDYLVVAQRDLGPPVPATPTVENLYLIRPDFSISALPGGPYALNPNTDEIVTVGTNVFFTFGGGLYVFDGESETVSNITNGMTNPNNLGAAGDKLFLSGGGSSNELWMSDGGSATQINPNPAIPSGIANITGVNGKAYFTVGNDGAALYHSDGTDAGTGEHAAGVNYNQVDHINPYKYETTAGDNQEALVYVANNTTVGRGIELHYARPCPEYELNYALSDFCSASGTESPSLTFVNGDAEAFDGSSFDVSTGTYAASPAGLSINTTNGEINVGTSTQGTYTVTYTAEWNGCTITASTEITISSGITLTPTLFLENTELNVGDFTGNSASALTSPVGMAISPDNNTLYFSDANNNRVRALNLGTSAVSNFYTGGGGFSPSGVVTDNEGNVYVGTATATGNQIYKFDASGTLLNGPTPPSIDANHIIMDLALDYQNNAYALLFDDDTGNKEIRRVGSDGTIGTAVNDDLGGLLSIGAGTVLSGLAIDPAGNFYVAGKNNRVYKINAAGNSVVATYDGSGDFDIPIDIAVTPFGEVFVANNRDHQINKIATDGTISVVSGTGSAGTSPGTNASTAELTNPSGIVINKQGGVYIADNTGGDSRIRRLYEGGAGSGGDATASTYTVCSGDNVDFILGNPGGTPQGWEKLIYDSGSEQWISENVAGAFSLDNQAITETTIYRALVTPALGFCPSPSNYALVTVRVPEQPSDVFIGASGTVDVSYCEGAANPTITATGLTGYKFYRENVTDATAPTEVADNASGTYTVDLTALDVDKTYRFYAGSNGAGVCAGDPTAGLPSVTINLNAVPADPTFDGAPFTRCGTGDVTLTASGAGDGEEYVWFAADDTELASGAAATYTANALAVGNTDFKVAIRNTTTGCESNKVTTTVTVHPAVSIPVFDGDPFTRCGAGDVTITVAVDGGGALAANEQYVWFASDDTELVSGTGVTYTATGLAVGTHDFKVAIRNTMTSCETDKITTTVTVSAVPVDPTFDGAPFTRCGAGDVTLTASGVGAGEEYVWFAADDTELASGADATYMATGLAVGDTDFKVAIRNTTTGCESNKVTTTVTVHPAVSIPVFDGTPFTRCGAGDVILTAAVDGGGALAGDEEYVWFAADDTELASGTGVTYTATGLAVGTHDFKVAIRNTVTLCETDKITTTVTVSAIPVDPTFVGAPFTGCDGQNVTLEASGAGDGEEYVWFAADDTELSSGTDATYTATGLAVGDTDFKVAIRNTTTGCESNKVTTTVTVSTIPTDPTFTGAPFTRCGAGDVTLTASGAGAGEEYVWYAADDTELASGVATTYTATNVAVGDTDFKVTVRNTTTGCESNQVTTTVTVHPIPAPVINDVNTIVCVGNTKTYSVETATAGNFYSWEISGGGTIVASGALTHDGNDVNAIDVNWTTTGDYTVSLVERNPVTTCENAPAVVLNVQVTDIPNPTVTEIANQTVFCQNNQVTLQVYGGVADANHTYTWEVENQTPAHLNNVILNQNVDNPAQAFVFWKEDADDVASAEVSIKVIVELNGTACQKEATFAPDDIQPGPTPSLSGDLQVCENETVTYTNMPSAANSSWRIEPSTAGIINGAFTNVTSVDITWNEVDVISDTALVIITETSGNGCSLPDTLEVVIADYLSPDTTAIGYRCDATPGQIQVKILNNDAQSFKFYDAETGGNDITANFTALNDSIYLTPLLSATTNYWITTVNINDCENPTRTMVTAEVLGTNRPPSIDSTIMNTCLRANTGAIGIQVDASAELQLPFDYSLTDESGGQVFVGSSTDGTISFTGLGIGNYTVSITDNGGCFYNEIYPIVLDTTQNIAVDLGEDRIIESGRPFALEAITDAEIVAYSWTPAEFFNDPTLANPEVTLDTITTVFVEVETVEGCVGKDSVTLDATSFNLYIPNTFSPNEDGANDRLQIFGEYIESLEFKVFDRLGNLVFSSSSVDQMVCFDDFGNCSNGWDGKDTSGQELPPGNYVWQMTGNFIGGIPLRADGKTSGNILIIR